MAFLNNQGSDRQLESGRKQTKTFQDAAIHWFARDKQAMIEGIEKTAGILAAAEAAELWTLYSEPVSIIAANGRLKGEDLAKFSQEVRGKGSTNNGMGCIALI